jgi:quercetin dioxygenase-like cupin family protein
MINDNQELKNGKYHVGRFDEPGEFGGWFVGSFFAAGHSCKNDQLEVMYKVHQAGDVAAPHYHQIKVELLIILEGKARYNINGKEVILNQGDFLFVDVNNIISGEFLEPTKIFAIHSPSIVSDKILVT